MTSASPTVGASDARTILITGASSGIGRATAAALARQGNRVVIVGRDLRRTRAAVDWMRRDSGNPHVDLLLADLTLPQEVRDLALAFRRGFGRLDVLINNAGGFFSAFERGADGFERTWALNHLAYVGLTLELLPLLRARAEARIINVSSALHRWGRIDFDDLAGTRRWSGLRAYTQSKLANVLFTQALARRLAGSGISVNSLHPGMTVSGLGRQMQGPIKLVNAFLARPFQRSAARGAATSVHLASAPEVAGVTGAYFVDRRPVVPGRAARDRDVEERLWRVTLAQLGLPDDVAGRVDDVAGPIRAGAGTSG